MNRGLAKWISSAALMAWVRFYIEFEAQAVLGAAIAGGMCAIKTKCAWLFGASEATKCGTCKGTNDVERSPRNSEGANSPCWGLDWGAMQIPALQNDVRALSWGGHGGLARPLSGQAAPVKHTGLHATGSVFVRPVDKTNLEEFLRDGDASLKCIHITEDGATPQWFISIAGQQHRSCDFAEARCTDGALLHLFEATTTEHFPIVIVVTRNPKVAIKWQGFKGAVVRRMNVGGSTVFLVRTRNESGWAGGTEAVREFILEACTTATLSGAHAKWF